MAADQDSNDPATKLPGAANVTAGGGARHEPKPAIKASDVFQKKRRPPPPPPPPDQGTGVGTFPVPPPGTAAAGPAATPTAGGGPRPLTFGKIFGAARPARRPESPVEVAPPAPVEPAAMAEIVAPAVPIVPLELQKPEPDRGADAPVPEVQAPVEKMDPPAALSEAPMSPETVAEVSSAPPSLPLADHAALPPLPVKTERDRDTALVEAVRAGSAGGQVAMALALAEAARAAAPEPAGVSLEKGGPKAGKRPGLWVALVQVGAKGFKVGIVTAVLLGGVFYFARSWLVPVTQELLHPGAKDALHDKGAPTAVRVLQQTRKVVAQNNTRVDDVNAIVNAIAGGDQKKGSALPAPPPRPAPAAVSAGEAATTAAAAVYQDAVDKLKVTGVFDGDNPRVYLNGLIVQYGQIVDRTLGLRFIGIDTADHAVVFSNADNVQFKKHY